MLKSICPYVDASYIMVDDRSADRTEEILLDYGCSIRKFSFENFSKVQNGLLKWAAASGDWAFRLPPDELITPEYGEKLRITLDSLQETDIDLVHYPRINWANLEMTERKEDYPDLQPRLFRLDYPRIHFVHYVHEAIMGIRRAIIIREDVYHFGLYWKNTLGRWPEANKLYRQLQQQQHDDRRKGINNIWPD
jgi:glycosyltransferase involved in cell wall biosynthesis